MSGWGDIGYNELHSGLGVFCKWVIYDEWCVDIDIIVIRSMCGRLFLMMLTFILLGSGW